MQNREELQQKGHDGSRKTTCRERGKKYHFQRGGGGINIVFGPKYRPLYENMLDPDRDLDPKLMTKPERHLDLKKLFWIYRQHLLEGK